MSEHLNNTVKTRYWHTCEDGRVQCDLCPRACKLKPQQRGLCYVRACEDNEIVLTTYGRSSGFCIDPIEKKPLNHFMVGTPVLSFGTAGCNLACKFCQNWDISKSRTMDTLANYASPQQLAHSAKQHNCRSIAFTYNDPVIFHEYAIDVAQACHEQDIKAVAVTAGYVCPEPRIEFYQYMDAANVDLKAFTNQFYRNITGSQLSPVLDTLLYLKHETKVWFEITNLIIPTQNDSDQEIDDMSRWISDELGNDVPLHFSGFHPDWKMQNLPSTPLTTLTKARDIAIKNGLNYVYTGNVHHPEGDTTYCPSCHTPLIIRDWYQIKSYTLNNNQCPQCNTPIHGVFEESAGNWGAKRQPIRIH